MLRSLVTIAAVTTVLSPQGNADDGGGESHPLRVMSFNIRYGTADDGDNSWPQRRELLLEAIRNYDPHILGTQEGLRFQLDEIASAMPHFAEAGVGRDDGKEAGEYTAIHFDRRRFELVEQNTFWLSDTPEKIASTSWGNEITRICTWVRLKEKQTDVEFYVFNVHWDHISQESREKSAQLVIDRIVAGANGKAPVIVLGDFNADEQNPAFQRLLKDEPPRLFDTFRKLHPEAKEVGTFNGFRGERQRGKIDAVLVTPHWRVLKAAIDHTNRDGRYPSDHFPVTATLEVTQ